MLRIDENTYIDDTLVTCAEYQLFIDEMREQGKYYQPDHWTSYQFPEGQAREPILGVRQSDAAAFCKWLTSQEGKKWRFGLPTQDEANAIPMKSLGNSPLGYWLDKTAKFSWIEADTKDARTLDFGYVCDNARSLYISILDALAQASKLDKKYARGTALYSTLYNALKKASVLSSAIAIDFDLGINRDIAHANDFDFVRTHTVDLARTSAIDLDLTIPSTRKLDPLGHAIDIIHVLTRARNYFLDFCVDIPTLQERIVGRSPAFEGIRLVKEHI